MKKIITIFSVLVALTFMAGPSYALVGMPDDVPGTDVLLPFFLVDMAGYDANEGLDTLIVITDVSGADVAPAGGTEGYLDFEICDKKSKHRGNGTISYTPNDVVPLTVRRMLKDYVGVNEMVNLEYDLDGDGTNDTYVGYIEFDGDRRADQTVDNLIAHVYLVDLANGRAAGTNAPVREWAAAADGYSPMQNTTNLGATDLEVFTGDALAMSDYRERNDGILVPGVNNLTLTPRWYLKDADATNYLFIWTSKAPAVASWWITVELYDEDENGQSITFDLPYELNIIDVREELPGAYTAKGGWFDINGDPLLGNALDDNVEWLAYSYQMAESASAGLNWSGLFDVHRNIGDFSTH